MNRSTYYGGEAKSRVQIVHMSTSEFRPQKPALEPKLRAALLASSFSRFRKEHHRYPITATAWAHSGVPLPIEEVLPKLHKAGPQPARTAHVARYITKSLERNERDQGYRSDGVGPQSYRPESYRPESYRPESYRPESLAPESLAPLGVHTEASALEVAGVDTDDKMVRSIQFDEASWTTEVTVCSRFLVTEQQAQTILTSARPPEWQRAASDFFKHSEPVEYDSASGRIEIHRENAKRECYQLYEQVEWDWSESTEGGLANILTIRQDDKRDEAQYARCLASLFQGSLLLESGSFEQLVEQAYREQWLLVDYQFELFRSLRSKFVSNWELGGLDVDEGAYVALWSPVTQRLYIKTNKRLRYSAKAGGIEGFSSMLNLLAPATVGMLLENLAYQGILEYLEPDE